MNKKILLMYISEHSGHHQASVALEKAVLQKYPGAAVMNVNAFRYVNPLLEKIIHKTYMRVIKNRPEIWGYLYDNPKVLKNTERLRNFVNNANAKKIGGLIKRFDPDVVGCTQAFPCGIFANYKKRYGNTVPLAGILTDYAPHAYWIYDEVDAYVVPSAEVGRALIKKGADESRIKILGVPIDSVFTEHPDRKAIYEKVGLSSRLPVVLVMGGTHGIGPDEKLIKALDGAKTDLQVIVIAGINKRLFKKTKAIAAHSKKKIVSLGFADNVHEMMEISDLIVTKPGGLTTAEALAKSLPMIIINPLPGQEDFNAKVLTSGGMAVKALDEEDAVRSIDDLLAAPGMINNMKEAMRIAAKPHSAGDIAELLLNMESQG